MHKNHAELITDTLSRRLARDIDELIARGLDAKLGKGHWAAKEMVDRLVHSIMPDGSSTYAVDGLSMFTMTKAVLSVDGGIARLEYKVIPHMDVYIDQQTNRLPDDEQSKGGA